MAETPIWDRRLLQILQRASELEAVGIIISNYFFFAFAARASKMASTLRSCHSLRECIFFLPNGSNYVLARCSTAAPNNENRSELSPSSKIFNVSTRISRFPPIFRLATTDKEFCLFHQILQPEGDVFGIRHRFAPTLPSRLTSMSTRWPDILDSVCDSIIAQFRGP